MIKIKYCKKITKQCKKCGELKLVSDFYKDSKGKDGHENQCKVCHNNKAKSRHLLVCLECGKEFTSQNKEQKFCSRKCAGKQRSKNFKNNPQYNRVEVPCEYCNKPIKVYRSEIKQGKHHFCSIKCCGKWQSENRRGENHPNWNPNLTDKERITKRNYEEYNNCVRKVLKRDNYTCRKCGDKRGGNLNAHHIRNYSEHSNLRTSVENGITLCEDCHKEFHIKFGYKNNNEKQIEEFMLIPSQAYEETLGRCND